MRVAISIMAASLGLATTAHGAPVWQRDPSIAITVGLGLVANLGELDERKRFGLGLDVGASALWFEGKHGWDGPSPISPVARASLHLGWTAPVVFSGLSVEAGALVPLEVMERGFVPGVGLLAGGGYWMGSDGWHGLRGTGTVVGPLVEGRVDAGPKHADRWNGSRLSLGLNVPVNLRGGGEVVFGETIGSVPPSPGTIGTGTIGTGTVPPSTTTTTDATR